MQEVLLMPALHFTQATFATCFTCFQVVFTCRTIKNDIFL
jgi:hypothetical protein